MNVAEGQLLLRMLRTAGAQLRTWAVGVDSQQPVNTHLKFDRTFLNCPISGSGGPRGMDSAPAYEAGMVLQWRWFSQATCLLGKGHGT